MKQGSGWERDKGEIELSLPVKEGESQIEEETEREEGGMDFPKDLCAISENHRDLSVKQNFPSI
jgi:hypothetical protein